MPADASQKSTRKSAEAVGRSARKPTSKAKNLPKTKNLPKSAPGRFVRKTKAERQREIIEATVQLLGEHGLQGVTVSRIAAAAGIARGTLYQHFPDREAVLEAALAVWGERSSAWLTNPSGVDIPERLLNIAATHTTRLPSEYNSFVRPFYQLLASNREPRLTRKITERQQEDFHYLVELVDEGKRQGSIRNDVESEDVAWSLLIHAWAEDIAQMLGADKFITTGASTRIIARLLATYTTPSAKDSS
jgi:AcrR family transcriptional regulator